MHFALQGGAPLTQPLVEEYGDDLYKDLYDDLSVSTVTVGPNVTDYEVSRMQTPTEMHADLISQSARHKLKHFFPCPLCADPGV